MDVDIQVGKRNADVKKIGRGHMEVGTQTYR